MYVTHEPSLCSQRVCVQSTTENYMNTCMNKAWIESPASRGNWQKLAQYRPWDVHCHHNEQHTGKVALVSLDKNIKPAAHS